MVVGRLLNKNVFLSMSVLFLLFCTHFYYLNRYGINIPFSDDYNEILNVIDLIQNSNTVSETTSYLLNGAGYSKPITLRLISWLHLSIFHEINFKYLVLTGNFFLLLMSLVFVLSVLDINKYLIITVSCFVFQPQYWEAIYQSTLSNSVFSCLFFSLASIYCMTQKKTYYYAASLLFALLAQISFGNGFLVYPILLMILLYNKNFKLFTVVFTMMLLCTYVYMLGNTASYSAGEQIEIVTKLKLWSVWLLEFLGSSVGYAFGSGYDRNITGKIASIIIGCLIIIFYCFLLHKKYYERNLLLFSFLTFFVLTALLATKLRFTVEVPGASRYQIQSALCILTTIIITVDMYAASINRYLLMILIIVFPLIFTFVSYKTNLPVVSGHKFRLATGLWSWQDRGTGLTIWSGEEAAGKLLMRCNFKNIYRIPSKQTLMIEIWKP